MILVCCKTGFCVTVPFPKRALGTRSGGEDFHAMPHGYRGNEDWHRRLPRNAAWLSWEGGFENSQYSILKFSITSRPRDKRSSYILSHLFYDSMNIIIRIMNFFNSFRHTNTFIYILPVFLSLPNMKTLFVIDSSISFPFFLFLYIEQTWQVLFRYF